jgi:hypothetical protein
VAIRLAASGGVAMRLMHLLRAFAINAYVRKLRAFLSVLRADFFGCSFRRWHECERAGIFRLPARYLPRRYPALLAEPARHQLCAH